MFFLLAFLYLYFIFFVNLVFILILIKLISGNSREFFNIVVELNNSLAFEELVKEIELKEKKLNKKMGIFYLSLKKFNL